MYWCTEGTIRTGDQLSFQNFFANADNRLSLFADVLRQRQDQLVWNGQVLYGGSC